MWTVVECTIMLIIILAALGFVGIVLYDQYMINKHRKNGLIIRPFKEDKE